MSEHKPPRAPLSGVLRFIALAAITAAYGCSCEEEALTVRQAGTCEPTFECPTGFEYRRGACVTGRCEVDEDCCPGQRCNAAAGFCADQFVACTRDAECLEVPGQTCIDFRGGQFCGYPNKGNQLSDSMTQRCETSLDCDEGRTCVGRRCLTAAPCDGGCGEGTVCDLDSNKCSPAQCEQTCTDGQIAVLEDPDTMSGPLCCLVKCTCATLPPVRAGQYGWYASLGVLSEGVAVSAYDPDYGDLVVARFDDEGTFQRVSYVDGFPTTGTLVGDPNGLRGGRNEDGPDIGQHTSIAIDAANMIHVAYQDVEQSTLRYALFDGSSWTTSTVDETGVTGLYTSIAIASDGTPRIAYMTAKGAEGASPIPTSALKYAAASSNMPMSAGDWQIETVDTSTLPIPVCGGGCARDQACVNLGSGPTCTPTTIGCGTCESGEACVDNMGMTQCTERISIVENAGLPEGTGLFASLAITSTNTPVIAYYDRQRRVLRLAARDANGGWRASTLDDGGMDGNDVGRHASVAVSPTDEVVVAYMDATADNLLYVNVTTGDREVIDDGIVPPNLRLVGADASLIFDSAGRPAIAYQDPTNIDLVYARRLGTPAMWSTEVLVGGVPPSAMTGMASGFYVSQARRGDTAFISNVDVSFTTEGELSLALSVVTKLLD